MSVILIGLIGCVVIAAVVVLLVALPGLRAEGRPSDDAQSFRLPSAWTGQEDEDEVFEEVPPLEEAEPVYSPEPQYSAPAEPEPVAAETAAASAEPEAPGRVAVLESDDAAVARPPYDPALQARRHAVPSLWTLRPRTRHWRVPAGGEGVKTALGLLFR